MRMRRLSPPELARECAGPHASTSSTDRPARRRCQAIQAPNAPTPITATSYGDCGTALAVHLLVRLQALLRGLDGRETASFLLDQVVLNTANGLRGSEDGLPWRIAFAEQRLVALAFTRTPLFQMETVDAAGIRLDPRDRVRAN